MKGAERIKATVKQAFWEEDLLICDCGGKELIVKARAGDLYPEDAVELYGAYRRSKKWGLYFDAKLLRQVKNELWLAKWLKLQKGLSDGKIVEMIVDKKHLGDIKKEWGDIRKAGRVLSFVAESGADEETFFELHERFLWKETEILENPYILLEYPGVSFQTVQSAIKSFGCADPPEAKSRYLLEHLLKKANRSGHLFLPLEDARKELAKSGADADAASSDPRFVLEKSRVYLKECHEMERWIAEDIKRRLSLPKKPADPALVSQWEKETGFTLAKNQAEASKMSLAEMFCVVTGGPGVGKTTVCKCITDILGFLYSIGIVAPTGRAAKRANESTGLEASTIHRKLEYNGVRFHRNENNPIEDDVLVIDESSMVDAPLLQALLRAVPPETKMIFVGDVDQLPSVGPGQILRDLIESGTVPVTRLTEIFRQAADSPIISCAYAINRGELPEFKPHDDLTASVFEYEEGVFDEAVRVAFDLYRKNDMFDVQVLAPKYSGPAGIDAFNADLQRLLNPNAPAVSMGSFEIRRGDKVIQTRNDYEKGIYNGDVGVVTLCSPRLIRVRFFGSDKETAFSMESFSDLQLCYATSVHRSQGSEYKCVVIPVALSHGSMLQKNLLYTAVTRAKKKLWLIYQAEALKKAVRLDSVPPRHTALGELLAPEEKSVSA